MDKLCLSAGLAGLTSKSDRSYTLRFDTLELSSEEISWLNNNLKAWGWIVISPDDKDAIENADIPTERAIRKDIKSPSERLRNVLYAWYIDQQEKGKIQGTFSNFYEEYIERVIQWVKEKLDT